MEARVNSPPCAACGHPHPCIGLGPPAVALSVRLCWDCFLLTPSGVQFTQDRVRETLGGLDDLHADEAVAGDEQGGN